MMFSRSKEVFENIERKIELPMLFATLLLLAFIIIRNSFYLSYSTLILFDYVEFTLWLVFFIELIVLTYFSQNRFSYLKSHWYNVLTVLLPLLKIIPLSNNLNLSYLIVFFGAETLFVRVIPLVIRGLATMKLLFRRHKLNYIIYVIIVVVVFLGPLATVFERTNPESNLHTVQDGIWWAFISMSTVGYGDFFPVTPQGRVVGFIVITLGVTLFSLLTAHISSIMLEDS